MSDDLVKRIKDRGDWLVDAVATSTQNRQFLRGEPECDDVACEAIRMNGEKAIEVIAKPMAARIEELEAVLREVDAWVDDDLLPLADLMDAVADHIEQLAATNEELEAKLAKAVEGFEELARLGNGDRYGNSLGNMIAQEYLAELKGEDDE